MAVVLWLTVYLLYIIRAWNSCFSWSFKGVKHMLSFHALTNHHLIQEFFLSVLPLYIEPLSPEVKFLKLANLILAWTAENRIIKQRKGFALCSSELIIITDFFLNHYSSTLSQAVKHMVISKQVRQSFPWCEGSKGSKYVWPGKNGDKIIKWTTINSQDINQLNSQSLVETFLIYLNLSNLIYRLRF